MAREYTVKINVNSAEAAQKIEQFGVKALATIEKINKVEVKPKTNIHDVEVATKKVEESANRAAVAENNRAAAAERSAATVARAHATEVNALEKTKQKELDLEKATLQANNKLELQRMRMEQGQSAMNAFSNATQKAVNQLKMLVGFAGATQAFRSAFNEMKAMSDELVTYQKVTQATAQQMKQVRADAYEAAKQYAQSPSDFLANSAMMARAGYGAKASDMAKLATMTQLVGDMSAEAASKFLISVDAGYQLKGNIEALTKVIDQANIADNNYATSLAQIAEGMTLIAPLAASMNVSVEETTAAIGTMQALTQRSGTEVARAFRMIAINIAKDTETEVEEGFKLTQENVEDFNALLQEFASEELKAANAAGKLLSPMKAIEAIAKAWKSGKLNEQQLFTVLNSIGGARYTNNIMALVKNFDVYEQMLSDFTTKAGSAMDEVDVMTKSWTAKLQQMKTAWTEMVNNRVSEDFIKNLLDMGKGFLEWTGNLENFILVSGGAVKAISALHSGIQRLAAGKSFGAINGWTIGISALVTVIGIAKTAIDNYKKSIQDSSNAASESAKKAHDQAASINELVSAYNELAKDGTIDDTELEEAKRIQEEINRLVDDLPDKYDLVTGSIERNKKALAEMNEEQRQQALIVAKQARNEARKALEDNYGLFAHDLDLSWGVNSVKTHNEIGQFLEEMLAGSDFRYYANTGHGKAEIEYKGGKDYTSISNAVRKLRSILDTATERYDNTEIIQPLYDALIATLGYWENLVNNLEDAENSVKELEEGKYQTSTTSEGTGSSSGSASSVEESTDAIDAYTESYNRLKNAIDVATDAQEVFNEATKSTKADALKFYGSALEAYNGELKEGRVNSTKFHAAAMALLGNEAYESTGGYTQNIQAMMNQKGSAGISLIDAITTLTATYKNQEGQVREGAGIAVLLEKLGYNVKDSQGNYVVKMTEDMYKEVMAAIPGLTRQMLDNALNAYDQYDIKGRNTDIAEKPKTETEQNTEATDKLTEQTKTTGDQMQTAGDQAQEAGEAAESLKDSVDALAEVEQSYLSALEEDDRRKKAEGIAAAKEAGATPATSPRKHEDSTKATERTYRKAQLIYLQGLLDQTNGYMEQASANAPIISSPKQTNADAAYDWSKEREAARAELKARSIYIQGLLDQMDGYIEQRKADAEALAKRTEEARNAGATPATAGHTHNQSIYSGANSASTSKEKSLAEEQDAKIEAKKTEEELTNLNQSVVELYDSVRDILRSNINQENYSKEEQFYKALQTSGYRAAFGNDTERAEQYRKAMEMGNGDLAIQAVTGFIEDPTMHVGVEFEDKSITFNDAQIAIKAELDKYTVKQAMMALAMMVDMDEEQRKAFITAVLDKYSLKDVLNNIQADTDSKIITQLIRTAIEQTSLSEVQAEFALLTMDKKKTIAIALSKEGDYKTLASLLSELDDATIKNILLALDPTSRSQVEAELAALGRKTVTVTVKTKYTGALTSSPGKDTFQVDLHEAVGTQSHPGGPALVNDGTGAELIVDNGAAYIANGGKPAVVSLGKGAKVYTAEQTRRMLQGANVSAFPAYEVGTSSEGSGSGTSETDLELAKELYSWFDHFWAAKTRDTSYTTEGGGSGSGSGGSGSGGSSHGTSTGTVSGSEPKDTRWDDLKSLIEYVLRRLNKALEKQEETIDKQISDLEARRKQSEQENQLIELQKAVTKAQSDLYEAENNRTVRYLNDNGQWEWMADQGKVKTAKEALEKSQKDLQDYLNDLFIDAQIKVLEDEKTRLKEEYQGYADLWSDILDAVDTPTGGLDALIESLTQSGTGAQRNGAEAVKNLLIAALKGGSYKENYAEAMGEIDKAIANNPSVPGITDAELAALIASSGTTIGGAQMQAALQSIAGGGTLAGGAGSGDVINHQDTYYMINGVNIGSDMAELPLSEVLNRLNLFNNTAV